MTIKKDESFKELLLGKNVIHGTNYNSPNGTTGLVTDGNETTGFELTTSLAGSESDFLVYDFENPVSISKYKLQVDEIAKKKGFLFTMAFVDSKGVHIFPIKSKTFVGDGGIYDLNKTYDDVKKAYMFMDHPKYIKDTYKVLEWGLYFGSKSEPDPEPDPDPNAKSILTITMKDEIQKEYSLSDKELTAFVNWYDELAKGVGRGRYCFKKTGDMGPFTKREEHIEFSKITTFSIDK
ncbi:hypothetical protein [Paraclostridium bifermentans]|uniref:hypothetical protein n=1 Tax=Paraclostridium bifermentans TaxID=1490 RepID=UPI0022E5E946|nr:hypothetical protein [Paraclostridium bifermentans]